VCVLQTCPRAPRRRMSLPPHSLGCFAMSSICRPSNALFFVVHQGAASMPPTSTAAHAGGFDATLQRARRVQAGETSRSPASIARCPACCRLLSTDTNLIVTNLSTSLTLRRRVAGKIEGEGGRPAQAGATHQANSIRRVPCNFIRSHFPHASAQGKIPSVSCT